MRSLLVQLNRAQAVALNRFTPRVQRRASQTLRGQSGTVV
ncbi:MAG: hypothetical protein RI925_310 [Pseudomonadota bacterium]